MRLLLAARGGARHAVSIVAALLSPLTLAQVPLADRPLFSTIDVPANVVLALSVEFPTAHSTSYPWRIPYTSASTYYGYFDPDKCYRYRYDQQAPQDSYFDPAGAAASHACSSSAATPLWSGNYLNWAAMHTLDSFRWVMTGGQRSVDEAGKTILQKTYNNGPADPVSQGGFSFTPNKTLAGKSVVAGATPFDWGKVETRTWGGGLKLWITGSGNVSASNALPSAVDYVNESAYGSGATTADPAKVYAVYVRVKVCDPGAGLESNCIRYAGGAKPEGLMQAYASKLRFAAFGYLNSQEPINGNTTHRDGGVLRAGMKYIGPTIPVYGQPPLVNPRTEWDPVTGQLTRSPEQPDADATEARNGLDPGEVKGSGVIRYLNDFGIYTLNYKHKDPVSELYYATVRYYKNLGDVNEYSSLSGLTQTQKKQMIDGFPVITNWVDPFERRCQKNFILGIGDVNAVADTNLYGSALRGKSNLEPSLPAQVAADTSIDTTAATNSVGNLEGLAGLGSLFLDSKRKNGYLIAGLAYDVHTRDIRPDLAGKQTITTYWADVLEHDAYLSRNQYWLAAKYGGLRVDDDFDPAAATSASIRDEMWYRNNDTLRDGTRIDKRPDNYLPVGQADTMKASLTKAFADMEERGTVVFGTAYSTATAKLTVSGSASYASNYDPKNWSGVVYGYETNYAQSAAAPTLTQKWNAGELLDDVASSNDRKIVTCCRDSSTSPLALPFTAAGLSGSLAARTYVASFAAVPGVAQAKQSIANYVAYLRGDRAQEMGDPKEGRGGPYRYRKHLLGDIVDSKPTAVGAPGALYRDLPNPGYSRFKRDNAGRKTVVYVGANDGMMHAFDGSLNATNGGKELFAYIPSFVYGTAATAGDLGLAALGKENYRHRYYVNATPQVYDLDFARTGGNVTTTGEWGTLLVGGLGKGGKGYYAIDITNPDAWADEGAVASKVLWEFPPPTPDPLDPVPQMGYSFGEASVVKTKKYGWVVILTSGYNNDDGKGYFYFLNPKTGALLEPPIATPEGSVDKPINLGHHTAYVNDYGDFTADAVYAGDLQGNVWRVDLTGDSGSYPPPVKIARLTDANGRAQPVTTRPLTEIDPNSRKRYIMVGTGRLLDDSDIPSTAPQTFYAIIDGTDDAFYAAGAAPNGGFPITRGSLTPNVDLLAGIGSAPTASSGWYYDLAIGASGAAERINVTPTANNGIVAVAINQPGIDDPCAPGGVGRAVAVAFASGRSVLLDGGHLIASTPPLSNLIAEIALVRIGDDIRLMVGGRDGKVQNPDGNFASGGVLKQLNWREVPTAD